MPAAHGRRDSVRAQLDRYGVTARVGNDAFVATVDDVVEAFRARTGADTS